jgi:hypothetical protein
VVVKLLIVAMRLVHVEPTSLSIALIGHGMKLVPDVERVGVTSLAGFEWTR